MQPDPGPSRQIWYAFLCVLLATAALVAGSRFLGWAVKDVLIVGVMLAAAVALFGLAFRAANREAFRRHEQLDRMVEAKPGRAGAVQDAPGSLSSSASETPSPRDPESPARSVRRI